MAHVVRLNSIPYSENLFQPDVSFLTLFAMENMGERLTMISSFHSVSGEFIQPDQIDLTCQSASQTSMKFCNIINIVT